MKSTKHVNRAIVVLIAVALTSCSSPQTDNNRRDATQLFENNNVGHVVANNTNRFRLSKNPIPNRYIVVMNETTAFRTTAVATIDAEILALATEAKALVKHTYRHALQGFAAQMTQEQALALSQNPRVKFVAQDSYRYITGTQTDAIWGLDRLDQTNLPLNGSYTYGSDGSGVTVYIVDTGIRISHNDFGSRASYGYSAFDDNYGASDCHGHGTHVAGTVGGSTWGVAKNVNLVAVRVMNCQGTGADSGIIAGIDWIAQNAHFPAVANLSIGGESSSAIDNAVQGAINAGVTFVVAAGNDSQNACNNSPARVSAAITVGSTTSSDAASYFSNYGSCVNIYAPGSDIKSCTNANDYGTATYSGTSMACPHVTGAAAMYLGLYPDATPAEVAQALTGYATTGKVSNTNGSPNKLLNISFMGGDSDPCEGESEQGRCEDDTLIWCEGNQVRSTNCAAEGLTCGYDDSINRHTCIEEEDTGNDIVELSNAQVVSNISADKGAWLTYRIQIPAGASNLVMQIANGTGDADLYTQFGTQPTESSYNCRPYRTGNNESCSVAQPNAGFYYISLHAYEAFGGVSLTTSFTETDTDDNDNEDDGILTLANGQTVSNLTANQSERIDFKLFVPAGASNLTIAISGGSGDADLYVRIDQTPTTSQYDCRPYESGNTESCAGSTPREGWYYISLMAYRTFAGVSLQVSYE